MNQRPLQKLLDALGRHVVMSDAQRLVVALWVVHTYLVPYFEQTPYLAVTSPQKGCGKSRLLEVLKHLVARPWYTIQASEATVYRKMHNEQPTLLLDEVDTVFNPKTSGYHEALRAILNAGHRKGATVDRAANFGQTLESFNVYGAKVLAGIGVLPDTIADRSIPIRLQRKRPDEKVERFFVREFENVAAPLREEIQAWASSYEGRDDQQLVALGQALAGYRPAMPEELSDRMIEGCEPLVAIADSLGWGVEARAALVELLTAERADSKENAELRLLRDIRTIFEQTRAERFHTEHLLMNLVMNGDGWADWYGKGLDANWLASLLKPYGIKPGNVRAGPNNTVAKGYKREDFLDAWSRYLSVPEADEESDAA